MANQHAVFITRWNNRITGWHIRVGTLLFFFVQAFYPQVPKFPVCIYVRPLLLAVGERGVQEGLGVCPVVPSCIENVACGCLDCHSYMYISVTLPFPPPDVELAGCSVLF